MTKTSTTAPVTATATTESGTTNSHKGDDATEHLDNAHVHSHSGEDVVEVLLLQRRHGHTLDAAGLPNGGQEALFDGVEEQLPVRRDVHLVQHNDDGLALVHRVLRQCHVLLCQRLLRVHHQRDHVRAVDRLRMTRAHNQNRTAVCTEHVTM